MRDQVLGPDRLAHELLVKKIQNDMLRGGDSNLIIILSSIMI